MEDKEQAKSSSIFQRYEKELKEWMQFTVGLILVPVIIFAVMAVLLIVSAILWLPAIVINTITIFLGFIIIPVDFLVGLPSTLFDSMVQFFPNYFDYGYQIHAGFVGFVYSLIISWAGWRKVFDRYLLGLSEKHPNFVEKLFYILVFVSAVVLLNSVIILLIAIFAPK